MRSVPGSDSCSVARDAAEVFDFAVLREGGNSSGRHIFFL